MALRDMEEFETYVKRHRAAIVTASAALAGVIARAGLVRIVTASGVAPCFLLGYDIHTTISDWNRDPPLQGDNDEVINELLWSSSLVSSFLFQEIKNPLLCF